MTDTSVARDQLRSIVERVERVSDLINVWDEVETWAEIQSAPEYDVSSWGRVKRNGRVLINGKVHGYNIVSLSCRGVTRTARVHRLVIEAFIGPAPFEGAIVAHNDGDRQNNKISNLRWASHVENQADRARHNTQIMGSNVHGSKLTEADIPLIRERIGSGERYPTIAADFEVSISTISLIKRERTWKHV